MNSIFQLSDTSNNEQMPRWLIFASGLGSNFDAIVKRFPENVCGLICNKKGALVIEKAKASGVRCVLLERNGMSRNEYDKLLLKSTLEFQPDLIIFAGWMWIVNSEFIKDVGCKIINLHPALPKQFAGGNATADALKAFSAGKIKETGCMIHEVTEILDEGKVLGVDIIPIYTNDTLETLKVRSKEIETKLLLKVLEKLI